MNILDMSSGVLIEFYEISIQNNQKGLFFHLQLETPMSTAYEAQRNELKTLLYILIGPICVLKACSLGLYLIAEKIKEKSSRKFSVILPTTNIS